MRGDPQTWPVNPDVLKIVNTSLFIQPQLLQSVNINKRTFGKCLVCKGSPLGNILNVFSNTQKMKMMSHEILIIFLALVILQACRIVPVIHF